VAVPRIVISLPSFSPIIFLSFSVFRGSHHSDLRSHPLKNSTIRMVEAHIIQIASVTT
jgi:hypothetical protein